MPEVPEVPDVPEVPEVPDLPGVPVPDSPAAPDGLAPGGAVLPGDVPDEDGGGAAPGVADDGGVVEGAVDVPVLPEVLPDCSAALSAPPLLQAVTLTTSRPSSIRILEACSAGFISLPFS